MPTGHFDSPHWVLVVKKMAMRVYKRKRGVFTSASPAGRYTARRRTVRRRTFVPGRDRTGGFYGRYNRTNGGAGGTELKFFDENGSEASIPDTGTITFFSINNIVQGTGEDERIGRKCTIKSLHVRYHVTLPSTLDPQDVGSPDTLRFIIFVDSQANGTNAEVTDILESASFQSFRNLANSQRFTILCDKFHVLNTTAAAQDASNISTGPVHRQILFNTKLNLPLEFSGVTGNLTELKSNNIGVLVISANGFIGVSMRFRLRFVG